MKIHRIYIELKDHATIYDEIREAYIEKYIEENNIQEKNIITVSEENEQRAGRYNEISTQLITLWERTE